MQVNIRPKLAHVSSDKPLMVIVDTSVFIHKIFQSSQLEHSDPNFRSMVSAQLVWLMSCEWLGGYRGNVGKVVFVQDLKDRDGHYWRHKWLLKLENVIDVPRKKKALQQLTEEAKTILNIEAKDRTAEQDEKLEEARGKLAIHYKAGRKFPEYGFTKLKRVVYELLEEMGAHTLGSVGYEADDCAASLVTQNKLDGEKWDILLLTVDTDWMQKISPCVTWVCMSGYEPVVRDTLEVCNTWAQRRLKVTLNTWADIVAVKGDKGDASDALPPSNGVLIPVIDLLEPPQTYKYWLRATDRLQCLLSDVEEPRFTQKAATAAGTYLKRLGCRPIIRYLPGEDPDILEYSVDYENQTVTTTNPF